MTKAAVATSHAGTMLVGLRFRPDAAARVFGVPAYELSDRHVPLDDLWNRMAVREASERLLGRRTVLGRVAVAHAFLSSRRPAIPPPDPHVQHAMALLSATGHHRVDTLAKAVGISERHLHRRFSASVGYNPKLFQRILRFQRLLALARVGQPAGLGHLAMRAGYADQAHMTREVCEFAGVTPTALVGKVVSALMQSELLNGLEQLPTIGRDDNHEERR